MITWLPAISPCYYVATWVCIYGGPAVLWQFWLGALSYKAYKSRRGQRNREEIGALLVHPARQNHTKLPCYPGYIYGGPAVVWL